MTFIHVGANFRSMHGAELAALGARSVDLPAQLLTAPPIQGAVVLATCNRFEVYVDATEFHPGVDAVVTMIRGLAEPDFPEVVDALEVNAGDGAVEHLFQVACGLDSMVVGEHEIAGQVRQSLSDCGPTTSPALRRLFQAALTTSKAVATKTTLGASGRSLVSIGLDLVATRLGNLEGRRVLLHGTGAYAGVVVAELLKRGIDEIRAFSNSGRAEGFAMSHPPVVPVASSEFPESLRWADAIVGCSGTGKRSLTANALADARAGVMTTLPILDLALASDVEPQVMLLPNVAVIDLEELGRHAPPEQSVALAQAGDLVEQGIEAFLHLEGGRRADPAVTAIRSYVSGIIETEIETADRRYSPETAEAVTRSLRRVSNALLHTPSVRAASLARSGELSDFTHALHTLFGIDVEAGR